MGVRNLRSELNRMAPAARDCKLGDLIQTIQIAVNGNSLALQTLLTELVTHPPAAFSATATQAVITANGTLQTLDQLSLLTTG